MKNSRQKIFLIIILGLAAVLRFSGLHWSLPNAEHYSSFHPDEWEIAEASLRLDIFRGEMNPHLFTSGSLYTYLVYFSSLFARFIGWLDLPPQADLVEVVSKIHLLGRTITALMGSLTVLLVYFIGRKVYNQRTGLIAALFLSLMPMHVMHSQFMRVDVPTVFFCVLSLWLMVEFASSHSFRLGVLAAFVVGLATSTKYNVGPVLTLTLSAVAWRYFIKKDQRSIVKKVMLLLLALSAGFFVGIPYSLFAPREFWTHGIMFNLYNSIRGGELALLFIGTGNGHWYHLTVNLPAMLGIPLTLLCLLGLFLVMWEYLRRAKGNNSATHDWILLIFLFAFFIPLGFGLLRFSRYLLPILPVLALFGGKAANSMLVNPKLAASKRWLTTLSSALVVVVVLYTLGYAIATSRLFVLTDSRESATAWLRERIGPDKTIAYIGPPSYALPPAPLCPFNGPPNNQKFLEWNRNNTFYTLMVIEANVAKLQTKPPDFLVISEIQYMEFNRLRAVDAQEFPIPVQERLREASELSAFLEKNAYLSVTFKQELIFLGIPFGPQRIPHDMMYVNPGIRIYSFKRMTFPI